MSLDLNSTCLRRLLSYSRGTLEYAHFWDLQSQWHYAALIGEIVKASQMLRTTALGLLVAGFGLVGLSETALAFEKESVSIDVLQDDAASTVLHFEFGALQRRAVKVDGAEYTSVTMPGAINGLEAGSPSLPRVTRSVIIPDMASMDVTVLDGEFYEIYDVDIVPSKGSILRTIEPSAVPYTFGKVYEQDAFWPAEPATGGEAYILRSKRGLAVTLNPVQYNPMTRTLRVYRNMTVAIDNVGRGQRNLQPVANKHDGGSPFHTIYSSHFVNYHRDLRGDPFNEEGSMLVIAADQFMANMDPFVDHKNSIGIATTLVPLSSVGSSWSQIHSYIGTVYNSTDLVYVLLVGDAAHIPASTSAGGLSDPNYSKQAGSDNYPDLLIGRFSCNNSAQIDTQVERTITYEAEQWTTKDEYLHAAGASSNQGPGDNGELDHEHMAIIGDVYLDWIASDWTQESDPSGSMSNFISKWNAGLGHIQYTGHGWQQGWSNGAAVGNSEVNSLTNTTMLPYIVTVGCVVGEYNTGDCFSEVTQWATHNGMPTGAIAHYGSTINQYWNEPMLGQDAMVELIAAESYFSMGALCFMGSIEMMDGYGASGVDMFDTWHIFGDPSVIISGTAQPPTGMRVSGSNLVAEGPNGGPFSPMSTAYTLTNNEEYSIEYSVVEVTSWLELEGVTDGVIPAMSEVSLTLSITGEAETFANGVYEGEVVFSNITNADGNVVKPAVLTVGTPQPVYVWDMSTNPGWTTSGQWAWGTPTGGGGEYGNPDPTSGSVGSQVMGYNLNGDYPGNLSETNLTTTAIDCSSLTDTSLVFDRYLNVETDFYDHAYLRVSNNGSQWTTVWENSGEIADSSWSTQEYDISAVADGQETVYVRWVMGTTDAIWNFSGWNIDEVVIKAVDSSPPCMGDFDGSGDINVNDLLTVIAGWGNGYGVDELLEVLGNWGSDC